MKNKTKAPDLIDIINELKVKRLFLGLSLVFGFIIVLIFNYYKSNIALPTLKVELHEQYFPVSNELKESVRTNMVDTFKDTDELLSFIEDKKFKEKIINSELQLQFGIDSYGFGTGVRNVFSMTAKLKTDDKKDHLIFVKHIKDLILNVEIAIRKKISSNLDAEINYYEKLIQEGEETGLVLEDYKEGLFIKKSELKKNNSVIKNYDISFLKIYPSKPSFSQKSLGIKRSAIICLMFLFGSIFLVSLNRVIKSS